MNRDPTGELATQRPAELHRQARRRPGDQMIADTGPEPGEPGQPCAVCRPAAARHITR